MIAVIILLKIKNIVGSANKPFFQFLIIPSPVQITCTLDIVASIVVKWSLKIHLWWSGEASVSMIVDS